MSQMRKFLSAPTPGASIQALLPVRRTQENENTCESLTPSVASVLRIAARKTPEYENAAVKHTLRKLRGRDSGDGVAPDDPAGPSSYIYQMESPDIAYIGRNRRLLGPPLIGYEPADVHRVICTPVRRELFLKVAVLKGNKSLWVGRDDLR